MESITPPPKVVNIVHSPYDVYIGRPSKWGNPFVIGVDGSRNECIAKFRRYITTDSELLSCIMELDGKILGCHCHPLPCHGDVLVDMVEQHIRETFIER